MTSIKTRLQLGLLVVIGFFIVQATIFYYSQAHVQDRIEATVKINTQVAAKLSKLAILAQQIRRYEKEYFIYITDIQQRTKYMGEWTQVSQQMQSLLNELQANKEALLTANEVEDIKPWQEAHLFYHAEMKKIFILTDQQNSQENLTLQAVTAPNSALLSSSTTSRDGKNKIAAPDLLTAFEANRLIAPGKDKLSNVLLKGVNDLYAAKINEVLALTGVINLGLSDLAIIFLGIVGLGIILIIVLMLTLPKSLLSSLNKLSIATEALSKGDTTLPVESGNVKEFAGLAASLERLRLAQQLFMERLQR